MLHSLEPEDFDVALRLMSERGWGKGRAVGPDGAICAARALNMAVWQRTSYREHADMIEAARWLGVTSLYVNAVVLWNDHNSTTWREVQQRFQYAAARMRGDA